MNNIKNVGVKMELDELYDLVTPMMKQYLDVKKQYHDCILFYRLGDFYEMFFDDALKACKILDIALTGRNGGLEERIPMCGIPYHAYETYLKKLLDAGYKVAICEQLEDAQPGKMVKRDVIKVISPGTNTNLDNNEYNYLMFIDDQQDNYYYLALVDLSTGKLKAKKIVKDYQKLINLIRDYQIKEIVLRDGFDTSIFNELLKSYQLLISFNFGKDLDNVYLQEVDSHYQEAFGNLFNYVKSLVMNDINYYLEIEYDNQEMMNLDFNTKYNLELVASIRNNEKYGTLYWYLDKTKSAMGSRRLKEYIENPLIKKELILARQDFIKALNTQIILIEKIRSYLDNVYDIARLVIRVANENISPKEVLWLYNSLVAGQEIMTCLKEYQLNNINDFIKNVPDVKMIITLIEDALCFELLDGNHDKLIKEGYHPQLDAFNETLLNSTNWLLAFEKRQKELTGINNLKVKYHKTFGYYIEISNSNKNLIKEEYGYIRKQTLSNKERYVNMELKEEESAILTAQDNVSKLEQALFNDIVKQLKLYLRDLQSYASLLADLDVMQALALISNEHGYSCPVFNDNHTLKIIDSFHPIIKNINKEKIFVNNDYLMTEKTNTLIITGPNMGGKSTYMRQLSIIVIMAQMGCFVPASEANMMIFDNIFTRIGASDNLIQGQSTFMVEMLEASNAILNATSNSLILFDEIGRGTATYDGMALAGAIIEYVSANIKSKLLFSTHYHELTSLEQNHQEIKNYQAMVIDNDNQISFTYKIKPGSIDKSYGLHVACLANIPQPILKRAELLLDNFENKGSSINQVEYIEIVKDDNKDIVEKIRDLNIDRLSPIDALLLLEKLKKEIK
ncbi:MAG: DNA mismatch repair protein MutS [Bacilli bacterium]|jgi:DNA mismatch repair protein MutS|nr:DNA mismatch repair protein MutS [Bacilli bacterium]